MLALKVTENLRDQLSSNNIVICTYIDSIDNNEVDCVDISYQSEYPELELITVNNPIDLL